MLYLLDDILDGRQIHHVVDAGDYIRSKHQHRIEYLAAVRNLAMRPLYQGEFEADFVWFLNDVFFCAEDVARLSHLASSPLVSMSCGLDYTGTSPPMFYDTWVARDMNGDVLAHHAPHFHRDSDLRRMEAGEPVPVYCCWNGMVLMKAALFREPHNLRFRDAHDNHECRGSECSNMCTDIWNVHQPNTTSVFIDPFVSLAYTRDVAEALVALPRRRDSVLDVMKQMPLIPSSLEEVPDTVLCNPLYGSGNHPDGLAWRVPTDANAARDLNRFAHVHRFKNFAFLSGSSSQHCIGSANLTCSQRPFNATTASPYLDMMPNNRSLYSCDGRAHLFCLLSNSSNSSNSSNTSSSSSTHRSHYPAIHYVGAVNLNCSSSSSSSTINGTSRSNDTRLWCSGDLDLSSVGNNSSNITQPLSYDGRDGSGSGSNKVHFNGTALLNCSSANSSSSSNSSSSNDYSTVHHNRLMNSTTELTCNGAFNLTQASNTTSSNSSSSYHSI